jgi:hypothetical protein
MRIPLALVCLVVGCSGGDLTLPADPVPADPAALSILSGNDQRADAGDLLEEPLVVQVLDSDDNPVPGTAVEFDFVGDVPGAVVDPALATTDEEGRAVAFVRLGTEDGEQLILARVAGTASPDLSVRFSAVALGSNGGGGGKKDNEGKGHGGGDEDDDGDDG